MIIVYVMIIYSVFKYIDFYIYIFIYMLDIYIYVGVLVKFFFDWELELVYNLERYKVFIRFLWDKNIISV